VNEKLIGALQWGHIWRDEFSLVSVNGTGTIVEDKLRFSTSLIICM
jgi:hypothetical protein